ncbi:MAG: DNA repair exonuclease [Clostridia bacterium]|nr:DNA repair exonuclease [Clostridia bacterium]
MKLLHMGDCHLDAAMESHLPKRLAEERRGELRLTFRRALSLIKTEGADAALLAGDVFDTPRPSAETLAYVCDAIASYPDTPFIIIEGNHDKGAWQGATLPENAHLVSSEGFESFPLGELTVHALSYPYRPDSLTALPFSEGVGNVYLLHGTLQAAWQDAASISPLPFAAHGADYIALGHYHAFRYERLGENARYCYAGTPEGRGFDETGACGAVIWDSEAPDAPVFHPLACRTLHTLSLSLTEIEGQAALEAAALAAAEGIGEEDMLRLVLTGSYKEGFHKNIKQLEGLLAQRFYFVRVKDESRLAISYEDYRHDVSLKGEFVRSVLSSSLSEAEKERVLLYGLRALRGEIPDKA